LNSVVSELNIKKVNSVLYKKLMDDLAYSMQSQEIEEAGAPYWPDVRHGDGF